MRLDRAHDDLRRGHEGSLANLAWRWGFKSVSMFSQDYLRRFGERPGQTRR
jgi:transcriptional regulator GlxA family with amidase domain